MRCCLHFLFEAGIDCYLASVEHIPGLEKGRPMQSAVMLESCCRSICEERALTWPEERSGKDW